MANISLCSKSFRRLLCISNELHSSKIWLGTSSVFRDTKSNEEVKSSNPAVDMLKKKSSGNYRPNKFEKLLLVWMKKYPSVAEVPRVVTENQMEYVRNWARIKIATYLTILTAIGMGVMIYKGKQSAKSGESLYTMNRDFHRSMAEKSKQE